MNIQYEERMALIGRMGEKLSARGLSLGAAESCTGGLISAWCTDLAGSSAWFKGAVISYANAVKEKVLGVEKAALETHGAVSRAVVEGMALGALDLLEADIALSVSGIAGPSGGGADKPVGTVWMAVARKGPAGPDVLSFVRRFQGDRQSVREQAAFTVLEAVEQGLG